LPIVAGTFYPFLSLPPSRELTVDRLCPRVLVLRAALV
jgi:hypothetical protein